MRKNNLWTTSLTLMLIVGIIMVGLTSVIPVYAQPNTVKLIDTSTGLSTIPDGTYGMGDKFNVTIEVQDVINMGGWKASITYDSSVVNYTGLQAAPPTWPAGAQIWEGAWFLAYATATARGTTWATFGPASTLAGVIVDLGDAFMPMPPGINGTGDLATIEFEVVGYATAPGTTIAFSAVDLKDDLNVPITPVSTVDLTFINEPPPPYAPSITDFSYSPTVVYENDIVTFTATTTPGFDGTSLIAVSEYRWDFDGDTVIDLTTGVPTADFNYTTAGTYYPALEVYAGPNPGYETASTNTTLKVYKVEKSLIDVYTENPGTGPNVYGSAFGPGEELTLYADLKYMGVPVNNTWVGFQIVDMTGDDVTFRSAMTVGGTATVNVRLPLMGTEHLTDESDFGTFKCIATANVFEDSFNDTVSFYVGWIVDTVSVTATDAARGGTTTITVTTRNWAVENKSVFLTVTVYDSVGVAVGVQSVSFTIEAATFVGLVPTPKEDTRTFGVLIPTDAWPGPAKVYVNGYDKPPLAGGDAWCSEISTLFTIS